MKIAVIGGGASGMAIAYLLADPTEVETKRFSAWKANFATTTVHKDTSLYENHGIRHPSEFDFFQTNSRWGYNSCLNQLSGILSPQHYFLSFQLEELIAKEQIIHIQKYHTPLYTTESFRYYYVCFTSGSTDRVNDLFRGSSAIALSVRPAA